MRPSKGHRKHRYTFGKRSGRNIGILNLQSPLESIRSFESDRTSGIRWNGTQTGIGLRPRHNRGSHQSMLSSNELGWLECVKRLLQASILLDTSHDQQPVEVPKEIDSRSTNQYFLDNLQDVLANACERALSLGLHKHIPF